MPYQGDIQQTLDRVGEAREVDLLKCQRQTIRFVSSRGWIARGLLAARSVMCTKILKWIAAFRIASRHSRGNPIVPAHVF